MGCTITRLEPSRTIAPGRGQQNPGNRGPRPASVADVPGLPAEARVIEGVAERTFEVADTAAPRLTFSPIEALWQRLILPLRPRSWRYTASLAVLGTVLSMAPWHLLRHPLGARAASAPSGWQAIPRDWVATAAAVEAPAGFRPFEPVLEEVAGAAPLTWHRVTFHAVPRGTA